MTILRRAWKKSDGPGAVGKSPFGAEGGEKARYSQGLDDHFYKNKATAFCVCGGASRKMLCQDYRE